MTEHRKLFVIYLFHLEFYFLSKGAMERRCCEHGMVLTTFNGDHYSCETALSTTPELLGRALKIFEGLSFAHDDVRNLTTIDQFDETNSSDSSNIDHCFDILIDANENDSENNRDRYRDRDRRRRRRRRRRRYGGPVRLNFLENLNDSTSVSSIVDDNRYSLLNIRRCCPKGEIFDPESRSCVSSLSEVSEDSATSIILNKIDSRFEYDFVHVLRGPPICTEGAIVDRLIDLSDIDVTIDGGSKINVTSIEGDDDDFLITEEKSCLDIGGDPDRIIVRTCREMKYCENNSCVKKCCPEGEVMYDIGECRLPTTNWTVGDWHKKVWHVPKNWQNQMGKKNILKDDDYAVLTRLYCRYSKWAESENWLIEADGRLYLPEIETTHDWNEYCIDMWENPVHRPSGFYAVICYSQSYEGTEDSKPLSLVKPICMSVSCAFLLATFLVYLCLPALRNLHGKTVMAHVGSMFLGYASFIATALYDSTLEAEIGRGFVCRLFGYTSLLFLLSVFFWLNVICFDLWRKIGSTYNPARSNGDGKEERKRFLSYCLFAWGMAFLLTLFALLSDSLNVLPAHLRPGIGTESCWFIESEIDGRKPYSEILFFIGPITILLSIDSILYVLTARRCSSVKADISKRVRADKCGTRNFESDKTILVLNAKLFVVMGISWVFEVLSFLVKFYAPEASWQYTFFYTSDVINCLQGVFIFSLFVVKRKVYRALKRRCTCGGGGGGARGKAHLNDNGHVHRLRRTRRSTTTSGTTISSNSGVNSLP